VDYNALSMRNSIIPYNNMFALLELTILFFLASNVVIKLVSLYHSSKHFYSLLHKKSFIYKQYPTKYT